jgi:hypothetical protein
MRKETALLLICTSAYSAGARLTGAATAEFDLYSAQVEAQLAARHASAKSFLAALDVAPEKRAGVERDLLSGGRSIQPVNGGVRELPGALLHHWRAAAFVPGATPKDMLALLRDYKNLPVNYAPQIVASSVIGEHGDSPRILVRLKQQKVVTIVLDAEYQVESKLISADRGTGSSRSVHIWEIDSPGTRRERRRAEGNDEGFLWRLNSYWTFASRPGGLLIECEAISLTRDIPFGLDWLLTPVIQELQREALEFTLTATTKALSKEVH